MSFIVLKFVLLFIFWIFCLALVACIPEPSKYSFQELQRQGYYEERYVHLDPKFSQEEKSQIIEGFTTWSLATDNYVRWSYRPWPTEYWAREFREPEEKTKGCRKHLVVFRQHSTDQETLRIEEIAKRIVSGWARPTKFKCGVEEISLVMDRIDNNHRDLKYVTMHELWHILLRRIDHWHDKISLSSYNYGITLSSPSELDLKELEKIYLKK